MSYMGRAEKETENILNIILNASLIRTQVPLTALIDYTEYTTLREEVQKHKFDMVIYRKNTDPLLVVEVNYKHGEAAAKKWRQIFEPMLRRYKHEILLIHDYECDYLFEPQDYTKHVPSWNDVIDVINALKVCKIPFNN